MASRSTATRPRGSAGRQRRPEGPTEPTQSRSLGIATRGIRTSRDFRDFMSALMSDVISGAVTPNVTNAACNAGGKMLKMVDLEYKYATKPQQRHPVLTIAFEQNAIEVQERPELPVPEPATTQS